MYILLLLSVGPDQGKCSCNQACICLPGWTGKACDCDLTDTNCISPLGVSDFIT